MIEVTFSPNQITVEGHAGAAPKGEDLVCAAVTMLVYALEDMLQMYGEGLETELAEGRYVVNGQGNCKAETAIEMFICGVVDLSTHYPEHVKLKFI